jgi:hypothetical protein
MTEPAPTVPREGGCQCGAVRYAFDGEPTEIYVCHCRECQKQSASAFGISVSVPRAALHLTRGAPRFWARRTDTGKRLECAFCPDCGTRVWHQGEPTNPILSVKGGSLDDPVDLRGAVHIWTVRMLPGLVLPEGAVSFPGEPYLASN